MPSLFDTIPGYREAVKRENEIRDYAFLDGEEIVAGVPVRPLTVRHWLLLDLSSNAFMVGGNVPTHRDIIRFLWVLSPDYQPDSDALQVFAAEHRKLDYGETCDAIAQFIEESMQDSPSRRNGADPIPHWSWPAAMVDLLASEYHWSQAEILDTPLKALFQYVKIICKRNNPKATLFNPSDVIRREWMQKKAEGN